MIYADTIKYSDLLFSSERQKFLSKNLFKSSKTATKQTHAYEKALNNLTL